MEETKKWLMAQLESREIDLSKIDPGDPDSDIDEWIKISNDIMHLNRCLDIINKMGRRYGKS